MIPEALRKRISASTLPTPIATGEVAAGDIRSFTQANGVQGRLLLVLAVDCQDETAQVTLVHPYLEYATQHDVVVPSSASHVGFDLVVQTDLRAVCWINTLGRRVGSVIPEVIRACASGADSNDLPQPMFIGPDLLGPLDARWAFKLAEGDELNALAASTSTALLDGLNDYRLEATEVLQALLGATPDVKRMMLALLDLWQSRADRLSLTTEDAFALDNLGLLDLNLWRAAHGEIGDHFCVHVLFPMIALAWSVPAVSGDESRECTPLDLPELRRLSSAR